MGGCRAARRDRDLHRRAWTGSGQLFGFRNLPDTLWADGQRLHQFEGDHDETWGGVTINIDSNLVHGPVYPTDEMLASSSSASATGSRSRRTG